MTGVPTLAFRPRLAVVVAVYLVGVCPDDDPDAVAAVDEGNCRYGAQRSKCSTVQNDTSGGEPGLG